MEHCHEDTESPAESRSHDYTRCMLWPSDPCCSALIGSVHARYARPEGVCCSETSPKLSAHATWFSNRKEHFKATCWLAWICKDTHARTHTHRQTHRHRHTHTRARAHARARAPDTMYARVYVSMPDHGERASPTVPNLQLYIIFLFNTSIDEIMCIYACILCIHIYIFRKLQSTYLCTYLHIYIYMYIYTHMCVWVEKKREREREGELNCQLPAPRAPKKSKRQREVV